MPKGNCALIWSGATDSNGTGVPFQVTLTPPSECGLGAGEALCSDKAKARPEMLISDPAATPGVREPRFTTDSTATDVGLVSVTRSTTSPSELIALTVRLAPRTSQRR